MKIVPTIYGPGCGYISEIWLKGEHAGIPNLYYIQKNFQKRNTHTISRPFGTGYIKIIEGPMYHSKTQLA